MEEVRLFMHENGELVAGCTFLVTAVGMWMTAGAMLLRPVVRQWRRRRELPRTADE